jgi:hypothetical protein
MHWFAKQPLVLSNATKRNLLVLSNMAKAVGKKMQLKRQYTLVTFCLVKPKE